MNRTIAKILGSAVLSAILIAQPAVAASTGHQEPSAVEMTADLIVARPVQLAATIVGVAVFVVAIPFTLFGGNVGQAGQTLVAAPAKATFARCLGCIN